jgi:hypothetical protein
MKMSSKHIAGMLLGGLVTLSAAVAPAAAQGLSVIAPTHPTWARWLGVETGGEFVLGRGRGQIQIGNFPKPRRVRVCVTSGTTPASNNVGARVIAEDTQIVVPVAHCGEIVGARITVEPAGTLGGKRRVKGIYSIVG